MVVIRLARGGSKKNPYYHVVVADQRFSRDGRYIERVGNFYPMARGKAVRLTLEKDRIDHWISQGAQPSSRVAQLIKELEKTGDQIIVRPTRAEMKQEQASIAAAAQKEKAAKEAKEAAEQKAAEEKAAAEQKAAEEKAAAEQKAAEATTEAAADTEAKEAPADAKAEKSE